MYWYLHLCIETFITITKLLLYQEGISIFLYGIIYKYFKVITKASYLLLGAAAHGKIKSCWTKQLLAVYTWKLLKLFRSFHCSKLFAATYPYNINPVPRYFLGTPIFKMLIFPYRYRGCLEVRKLWVFKTSNPLKTYFVKLNT